MKIAITGAKGMLANALINLLEKTNNELILIDLPEVDITRKEQLEIKLNKADFVYHLAAYTNVDRAESEPENARAVNEIGTRNVAQYCRELNIPLLYISTDYIFGTEQRKEPWQEDDKPSPQGVYAQTKLAGEKAIKDLCRKYFIVRTAWLYGPNGKNFVDTMLKLAGEQKEIKVVADQRGSPTFTRHLAKALIEFLNITEYGIYHLTNSGETTWYDLAKKVFELANVKVKIAPCQTKEFPRPAPRPRYSVLGNEHWLKIGGKPLPLWEDGLKEYLKERKQ